MSGSLYRGEDLKAEWEGMIYQIPSLNDTNAQNMLKSSAPTTLQINLNSSSLIIRIAHIPFLPLKLEFAEHQEIPSIGR